MQIERKNTIIRVSADHISIQNPVLSAVAGRFNAQMVDARLFLHEQPGYTFRLSRGKQELRRETLWGVPV